MLTSAACRSRLTGALQRIGLQGGRDMEDLIIYGAGALAVRGARRMFFGPSREARLADQVTPVLLAACRDSRRFSLLRQQAMHAGDGSRRCNKPSETPHL